MKLFPAITTHRLLLVMSVTMMMMIHGWNKNGVGVNAECTKDGLHCDFNYHCCSGGCNNEYQGGDELCLPTRKVGDSCNADQECTIGTNIKGVCKNNKCEVAVGQTMPKDGF